MSCKVRPFRWEREERNRCRSPHPLEAPLPTPTSEARLRFMRRFSEESVLKGSRYGWKARGGRAQRRGSNTTLGPYQTPGYSTVANCEPSATPPLKVPLSGSSFLPPPPVLLFSPFAPVFHPPLLSSRGRPLFVAVSSIFLAFHFFLVQAPVLGRPSGPLGTTPSPLPPRTRLGPRGAPPSDSQSGSPRATGPPPASPRRVGLPRRRGRRRRHRHHRRGGRGRPAGATQGTGGRGRSPAPAGPTGAGARGQPPGPLAAGAGPA